MPYGPGTYGKQVGRPPEEETYKPGEETYKPKYFLGGLLKTVGGGMIGGISNLLGKNQQPTTPAMDPTGAADISSLEARISALESGMGGGAEGTMASNVGGMASNLTPMNPADMERQRLMNQTSNVNQVGKLFAEEGGVVNTNNIARRVMAENGAVVGNGLTFPHTLSTQTPPPPVKKEKEEVVDTTWSPDSGEPPPGFKGDIWKNKKKTITKKINPWTGEYEDVVTWESFKEGGCVQPNEENMQTYKPNVTIIIA